MLVRTTSWRASAEAMRTNLCVVARRRSQLYAYLSDFFAGRPDVEIVLDRRLESLDRRQRARAPGIERRLRQRRVGPIAADLARRGFAVLNVRRPHRVSVTPS